MTENFKAHHNTTVGSLENDETRFRRSLQDTRIFLESSMTKSLHVPDIRLSLFDIETAGLNFKTMMNLRQFVIKHSDADPEYIAKCFGITVEEVLKIRN